MTNCDARFVTDDNWYRASMAPGAGAAQDVDLRAGFDRAVFFQEARIDLLERGRFAAPAPSIACARAAVVAGVCRAREWLEISTGSNFACDIDAYWIMRARISQPAPAL